MIIRVGAFCALLWCFSFLGGCTEKLQRACESDNDCRGSAPALYCLDGRCQTAGCRAGETEPCYEGDPKTRELGSCRVGRRICQALGVWSVCLEQSLPQTEICDRRDNDCDGTIDEVAGGCECFRPGASRACYSGPEGSVLRGLCQSGIQYCEEDGRWGTCNGEILPKSELCDGQDDDCDGKIDEVAICRCQAGQTRPCYAAAAVTRGVGACKEGLQRCENGTWGECQGQVLPSPETCDGQDNDCDRKVDETCACQQDSDCTNGQLCCGGTCRDVGSDARNCGRCGLVCTDGLRCVGGACDCSSGFTRCDGRCVDLRVASEHCGGCGIKCPDGGACKDGKCALLADPCSPKVQCGEGCVELKDDILHCGVCFGRCLEGERCVEGRCVCDGAKCGPCAQTCAVNGQICIHDRCQCAAGWSLCSVQGSVKCLDLQSDPLHCGACGYACPSGVSCVAGKCACPPPKEMIDGVCVDRQTNSSNCGEPGLTCPASLQSCQQGRCECPSGWGICSVSSKSVCHDFQNDPMHCGACDRACSSKASCQGGKCICPSGQIACKGSCVDLMNDPAHCGACGRSCPGGRQSCSGGACKCASGWWICPEGGKNTCVDPQSDPLHCGACERACPAGSTCQSGRCVCTAGLVLCGNKCAASCGSCSPCSGLGETCQDGACVCPPEQSRCIVAGRYVCVHLQKDPRHCGVCGRECEPNQACVEGVCQCSAGKSICNGRCLDFLRDDQHCGGCGKACPYGQTCLDGECKCPPGKSLCIVNGAYRCVDLNQDVQHCGACNLLCSPGATCSQGVCSCPKGKISCGGKCVDALRDRMHCGTCRAACSYRGQVCVDGSCVCPPFHNLCILEGAYACMDLQRDPRACGGCPSAKTTCSPNQICVQGVCSQK